MLKNICIPSLTGRGRGVRHTFSTNIVSLTGRRKTVIAYLFRIPKIVFIHQSLSIYIMKNERKILNSQSVFPAANRFGSPPSKPSRKVKKVT
jgi:hypothetical protein